MPLHVQVFEVMIHGMNTNWLIYDLMFVDLSKSYSFTEYQIKRFISLFSLFEFCYIFFGMAKPMMLTNLI